MAGGVNSDGTQVLLGRGKVYFDRFDAALKSSGERYLGDCDLFEITPAVEMKEKYSSADTAGGLLSRAVTRQTHEVSIQFSEISAENVALALLGATYSLVQASGSVTAEVIGYAASPGIQMDRWYKLANRACSAFVVSKGATPLTITTDYLVDLVNGRVLFITGGPVGVVAGDTTITCAYTKTSKTYSQVLAGTHSTIYGKLVYIGDSLAGPNYHVEIWKVVMTPDGALGLISEDYASPKLKATVMNDATNHATSPYYTKTLIPTS